jgi:septal ring factor EnvC (AmiA/AmiB activator)
MLVGVMIQCITLAWYASGITSRLGVAEQQIMTMQSDLKERATAIPTLQTEVSGMREAISRIERAIDKIADRRSAK